MGTRQGAGGHVHQSGDVRSEEGGRQVMYVASLIVVWALAFWTAYCAYNGNLDPSTISMAVFTAVLSGGTIAINLIFEVWK
jgi:hypothetical protein